MKKLFLVAMLALFAMQTTFAQQSGGSVIDKFFQKYSNDESFTLVSISPKMFSMFSKLDANDPDAKQVLQIAQKLRSMRILAKEDTKDGAKLYKEAAAYLTNSYEELMTVRSKGNDVKFLTKENAKGNIEELIMLVGGDDTFVAISIVGDIDLNQISKIANGMNITGMEDLKQVNKKAH
ncbi:protein of unknown function [Chitinophaga costaii]|uniref:DUF4252 domain-containing protein n=1 Tax=Chitinophaga costaii TaxID=1335309 RepID=A0A1C4FDR8_9BACT|nr:DUF4252 domain-containing protein [Chitinophaga costaii]PUZ20654.1 DUF4252 domain-containing protein [Chitinophaga costaii]SCC54036.1 protein of unknown function [Chitinophaga costaii]